MTLRKTFLWAVLGSLVIAAFLGIQSLLFDMRSGRWIGTMFSIVLFSLTSLGASIVLERRIWMHVMRAAIAISLVGLALFLISIWSNGYDPTLQRVMGLTCVWAIGLPIAGMLMMARFEGFLVAYRNCVTGLFLTACAFMSLAILAQHNLNEFSGRLLGVLLILSLLGTISIPILYRMHGIELRGPVETSPLELRLTCPRCLLEQTVTSGPSRCTQCKLKFTLEIEEPRCPECNYLLYRLTTPRCPECGHGLGADEVEAGGPMTLG